MGMRKPLYLIASGVALLGWSAILYLPLPLWALVLLLIPTGFASGNIIIGFAWAKESVPLRLVGTASGVCNMGPLLGRHAAAAGRGLDARPALERRAGRTACASMTPPPIAAPSRLMFVTMIVAAFVLTLAKDSHAKQMHD
jgi:hypothetical protein